MSSTTTTRTDMSARYPLPLSAPRPEDELPPALSAALTAAVPPATITTILERHVDAHKPQDPRIIALLPHSISISYLQPVREYWFHPLAQIHTVRITPALPPAPASPADQGAWIEAVVTRLDKFAAVKDAPVYSYLPPSHWRELLSIAIFGVFTLLIVAHIAGWPLVDEWIFTSERRFNMAMAVHCGILIKRSKDFRELGDLLEAHWRGGRSTRYVWLLSGWIEGWRAVSRFRDEAAKATLLVAEEEEAEEKESKKRI